MDPTASDELAFVEHLQRITAEKTEKVPITWCQPSSLIPKFHARQKARGLLYMRIYAPCSSFRVNAPSPCKFYDTPPHSLLAGAPASSWGATSSRRIGASLRFTSRSTAVFGRHSSNDARSSPNSRAIRASATRSRSAHGICAPAVSRADSAGAGADLVVVLLVRGVERLDLERRVRARAAVREEEVVDREPAQLSHQH
jgi:hypothetical protein